ncbi:hypothetical protein WN944_022536 [Citrus x changshan-huyou]|uniref:Uncharacterized protein n=1 Tax=Citrus x changshan-huyou TaxID=2935761 RepID=A0AAP0R1D2_9ROSI
MEELRRRHDEFAYDALIEALTYIIMLDMAKKPDEEMFANGHSAKPVPQPSSYGHRTTAYSSSYRIAEVEPIVVALPTATNSNSDDGDDVDDDDDDLLLDHDSPPPLLLDHDPSPPRLLDHELSPMIFQVMTQVRSALDVAYFPNIINVRKTLGEELEDDADLTVCIFNVPRAPMSADPDSSTPQQIAIGPYSPLAFWAS